VRKLQAVACVLLAGGLLACGRSDPPPVVIPGGEAGTAPVPLELPALEAHVRAMTAWRLGGQAPRVQTEPMGEGIVRVRLSFDLARSVAQDDWQVQITPAFEPTFHWSPHLTPTDAHIVDQHVFRSPALIVSDGKQTLAIVPDLDLLQARPQIRWYLDLDAPGNRLSMGMSDYAVADHVLFTRKPGARHPSGTTQVGFYALVLGATSNPFREVLAFLWKRWGAPRFATGAPLAPDLMPYVRQTYRWAFGTWEDVVWQEIPLPDRKVGAPVFIVNQSQGPNYPRAASEREIRSVWNQAWFSSLRSASGLYRHARRTGDPLLMDRANQTKELALAAPMRDGLFPSVIATEMEEVEVQGQRVNRSRGWQTAFWGNSDRSPVRDVRQSPYHLLDMSWTALLMLRWHQELEADPRLVAYARAYAEALVGLQREDGFFPAWLDLKSGRSLGLLDDSPETSMSVTFLLELAKVTGEPRYQQSALKALEAVVREVLPPGRWEDFETYWSCSDYGAGDLIGRKVVRNNLHKQSNLSMFWTAEALLEAYQATGEPRYLASGQRVLDELLMTQASWQPPYLYVPVLGGFGVMNADGEWNDARSSLFAELIIRYGQILDLDEYVQRGLAAMRSSFVMMYTPLNPATVEQWERDYPWLGPADHGFTIENYGHGGWTAPDNPGLGDFTIYDWGNGAAAEAYNRLLDHLGEPLLLRAN
jgi:hypothetical protein